MCNEGNKYGYGGGGCNSRYICLGINYTELGLKVQFVDNPWHWESVYNDTFPRPLSTPRGRVLITPACCAHGSAGEADQYLSNMAMGCWWKFLVFFLGHGMICEITPGHLEAVLRLIIFGTRD